MRRTSYLAAGLLAAALLAGSVPGAFAAKAHAKLAIAAGQVSGLSGSTFTLTRTAKKAGQPVTVAVTVAANATEKARKGTSGPLANGDYAVVVGTSATTGFTATRVLYSATKFKVGKVIKALRAARHHARGIYSATASTASSLVLKTKAGKSLTFAITAATKYRVGGKLASTAPTFTDGQVVLVRFSVDKATKARTALVIAVKAAA